MHFYIYNTKSYLIKWRPMPFSPNLLLFLKLAYFALWAFRIQDSFCDFKNRNAILPKGRLTSTEGSGLSPHKPLQLVLVTSDFFPLKLSDEYSSPSDTAWDRSCC